jgi:hypothetical protein
MVIQHFIAGGIAGIAHATLLLLLESVKIIPSLNSSSSSSTSSSSSSSSSATSSSSNASLLKNNGYWTNHNKRLLFLPSSSSLVYHVHVPTWQYTTSLVLHNTISHSILFGMYQLSKQCLEQQQHHRLISQLEYTTHGGMTTTNNNSGGGANINNNHHDYDINDVYDNIVQFATIAIAGGVAGQCQYVVSYMSERWLGLVIDESYTHHHAGAAAATTTTPTTASTSTMNVPFSTLFQNYTSSSRRFVTSFYSTVPTIRSIILSFPSSAIGFLAYEYGKLMME